MGTLSKYYVKDAMPDLWDGFFKNFYNESTNARTSMPAVNIAEDDNGFHLDVAAPGYSKDDFKVNVDKDLLTIEVEKEEQHEEKNDNFSRKEFHYGSFKRSFTLPETVNADKVSCKYVDGVLNIDLPKREEAKPKPARQIAVK